jgi:hypothetical protein
MQELMDPSDLANLGKQLETALAEVAQSCLLPTDVTKLRRKT